MNFIKGKITGDFDVIIAENVLEYTAIERGRIKKIGSIKVRLVSPEDLIIHKIASFRPRDIEDINGILIRQKGRLDINYIRRWLKKIDKVNKKSQTLKLFKSLLKKAQELSLPILRGKQKKLQAVNVPFSLRE